MSKRKSSKTIGIIITIILAIIGGGFLVAYSKIKNKEFFLNELFLSQTDTLGVDISNYQGDVDIDTLKAQNINFAFIKATEGSSFVDEKFATNWQNTKESGLPAGAYHFFSFESGGDTQAQNYIKTVGDDLTGRLFPAVDVELYKDYQKNPPAVDDVVRELKQFLTSIESHYHVRPIIYAPKDIYKKYIKKDFGDYTRWGRSVYWPISWTEGDNWTIWQYKDRGQLDGYIGDEKYIDLNVLSRKHSLEEITIK